MRASVNLVLFERLAPGNAALPLIQRMVQAGVKVVGWPTVAGEHDTIMGYVLDTIHAAKPEPTIEQEMPTPAKDLYFI